MDWQKYEYKKRELQKEALSPDQYESRIKSILRELEEEQ